jgi:hypothetical protein
MKSQSVAVAANAVKIVRPKGSVRLHAALPAAEARVHAGRDTGLPLATATARNMSTAERVSRSASVTRASSRPVSPHRRRSLHRPILHRGRPDSVTAVLRAASRLFETTELPGSLFRRDHLRGGADGRLERVLKEEARVCPGFIGVRAQRLVADHPGPTVRRARGLGSRGWWTLARARVAETRGVRRMRTRHLFPTAWLLEGGGRRLRSVSGSRGLSAYALENRGGFGILRNASARERRELWEAERQIA